LIRKNNWLPYLVYALLSLAILGPLLRPGYILSLDMVFTPHLDFTSNLYGLNESLWTVTSAPLYLVMQELGHIIPPWLIEKIILFLTFFVAGVGIHRLPFLRGTGAYFAGVLYMMNPFTYVRLMAGQWGLLVGYALIPFAVGSFISLVEGANLKKAVKLALLTTLVTVFSLHSLFILLFVYLVIFSVKLIAERKQLPALSHAGKYASLSAIMFLALNVFWLAPVFTGGGTALTQISGQDIAAFAPRATSHLGTAFDIASMHGFWRGGYLYIVDFVHWWWVFPILIILLALYGAITGFRVKDIRWPVTSFAIIGILGFVLALGAGSRFTSPIFTWLFEHFPFFSGFRDSQKLVGLLCLAYAALGGLGVSGLVNSLKTSGKQLAQIGALTLIIVAFIVPPYYSLPIFGTHGQLETTDYPQEWYEVNKHLNTDQSDFNVLFLPWHLYMDYSWLPNRDKRLADPAACFFDKPVISGDNMEVGDIYSESTNPVSKYVEFLLQNRGQIDNLGELLAPLNVKYILLVQDVDYTSYAFLNQQKDLTVELELNGLTLFRNEHPLARAYSVDSLVYIKDWQEYLELSQSQDATEHLYIIGQGQNEAGDGGMEVSTVTARSPVKYDSAGSEKRWAIFTLPHEVSTHSWEYDSTVPLYNLGFIPAFATDKAGGEVVFTRFYRLYLPSYIASAAVLCILVAIYLVPWRNKTKRQDSDH
jgi:hypothetical protein